MGMPDPDELVTSTGTWEQILVPLAIYSCAFALTFVAGLVCLVSVVFWGNISSKLAASVVGRLFKGTIFSWANTLSEWKSEIWTKLPTVCVVVLLALGYATCSALAMACGGAIFFLKICSMYEDYLEALVSYSLKVLAGKEPISWQGLFEPDASSPRKSDSDDEEDMMMADPTEEGFSMGKLMGRLMRRKEEPEQVDDGEEKRPGLAQISVHITTFMIYVCAFIPSVPALLVWAHNFHFNPRLEQDDMLPSMMIMAVCGLGWIHSFPKPYLRLYEPVSHFLFVMALLVAMYAPTSTYRMPYFVAATLAVVAGHQVCAPQDEPPQKRTKRTDQLDLAVVDKILRENEITVTGEILAKPNEESLSDESPSDESPSDESPSDESPSDESPSGESPSDEQRTVDETKEVNETKEEDEKEIEEVEPEISEEEPKEAEMKNPRKRKPKKSKKVE